MYTIGILDFVFEPDSSDYFHHEVRLVDMGTKEVFYDKLTYVYIEMPKFTKGEGELETVFDKWLYAMKNLGRLMERPPALQEAVFSQFFRQAEIARLLDADMRDYRESQKDYWDMFSVTETAEKKGRAAGLEEGIAEGREESPAKGREEGREEGKADVARKMKAKGFSVSDIAEVTGLSAAEVERL